MALSGGGAPNLRGPSRTRLGERFSLTATVPKRAPVPEVWGQGSGVRGPRAGRDSEANTNTVADTVTVTDMDTVTVPRA